MSITTLTAELRTDKGKGASRRLRRLEQKIPAIIYGGKKEPVSVHFEHKKIIKVLENEAFYSAVFDVSINGKTEHVILKDIQRHPYKPVVMHMDLQRVNSKDVIVKMVPIHFINEATCKGVKSGGIINHLMTQVEVRCQAKDLPEHMEIDMLHIVLDQVLHMSDLKLPKGAQFTVDLSDETHNHPIVSVHKPRGTVEAAPAEEVTSEEEPASE